MNKLDELTDLAGELLGDDYNKINYSKDELYNKGINVFNLIRASKYKKQLDYLLQITWLGSAIEKELCKDRFNDEFNKELVNKLFKILHDIIVEYINNPEQD